MKEIRLNMPQLALIAGTRVLLGWGLALLFSDRFNNRQRKTLGWTLFLAGVSSTVPLGRMVLDHRCSKKALAKL